MKIRSVIVCVLFLSWFQVHCSADESTNLVAKVQQADANVTVSCKLDNKYWIIGEPLSVTAEVENRGSKEVRVFDPMHDMLLWAKMITMRVTRLEMLDENKRLIGDLFAREGGSDLPRLEKFWLVLPPNGICQSKIRCHHAGYVPRTRFINGRELPPGTYYLRLVVTNGFLLSNYRKDPNCKDRLAESELVKIELAAQ